MDNLVIVHTGHALDLLEILLGLLRLLGLRGDQLLLVLVIPGFYAKTKYSSYA
jgi:hypothetical protein